MHPKCVMTILYPVGMATMETHRTLEKERDKLILLKIVLHSRSLRQLLNIDQISDCLVTEWCGQIDRLHNFTMNYHHVSLM